MPWRQLGLLALLALLIAMAVIGYIGTQQPRLPAPFGPAANGLVAYAQGGDIFTADPVTGVATRIVASPETDVGPRFSRDGTRLVFERTVPGGGSQIYVVSVDGSDLTRVTPKTVFLTPSVLGEAWEQYQFSPDGRSILIATSAGKPGISIARSDGSGVREIAVALQATEPSFRPDGSEILFVGDGPPGQSHGVYAVDPASGAVRTIVEPLSDYDLAAANWSPDGSHVAYSQWGGPGAGEGINPRTHIVSADGTGDRLLPIPRGAVWQSGSDWSNDGTRLFILRGYTGAFDDVRAVVIPVDGTSVGVELAYDGNPTQGCCAYWEWSPDDSKIFGRPVDNAGLPMQQVIIDPRGGGSQAAPWTSISDPAWQRVAP
jgi:Tol biopolymer transport system component